MTFSLYDALVPSFRQMVGAVTRVVNKTEAFASERGISTEDMLNARLADDMLPYAYQVKSVAVHSAGAIQGVEQGVFSPDMTEPPKSFDGLRDVLGEADRILEALDPGTLNAMFGREMRFEMGARRIDFTAQDFLLSFSQPNFYFHATTAYAVARARGVPLGKMDFMGKLRMQAIESTGP